MKWYDIAEKLLPPVYQAINDVYAYAKALNDELLEYLAKQDHVSANCFIQTCDLQTIEYWESLLNITLYGPMTLDERRYNILLHLNNRFPYSEPYIRAVLTNLFGEDGFSLKIDTEFNRPYHLIIEFFNTTYDKINQFHDWFFDACPAHIRYDRNHREDAPSELEVYSGVKAALTETVNLSFGNGSIQMYLGENQVDVPFITL